MARNNDRCYYLETTVWLPVLVPLQYVITCTSVTFLLLHVLYIPCEWQSVLNWWQRSEKKNLFNIQLVLFQCIVYLQVFRYVFCTSRSSTFDIHVQHLNQVRGIQQVLRRNIKQSSYKWFFNTAYLAITKKYFFQIVLN